MNWSLCGNRRPQGKPTTTIPGIPLIDSTIVPTRAEASLLALCRVQPIVEVTLNDCANESRDRLACTMPIAVNRRVELNAKEFDEETGMYYFTEGA
ncbi:MAG: hypothetical protein ACLTGI_07605 [Hoylesella buccalis]